MARYWTCRRCGYRNERTSSRRCQGCQENTKPKARVPKHAQTLRDDSYENFLATNREIHGVGDECAICGRPRGERRLDRDHDHASGRRRGLLCGGDRGCNKRIGNLTLEQLEVATAYLLRVEAFYRDEAAE